MVLKKYLFPKKLPNKNFIKIQKASSNNLKNIDANIPVGLFTCVTGVSGSGKSTLINDTLLPFIHNYINKYQNTRNNVKSISGVEFFDKVIEINQSPIRNKSKQLQKSQDQEGIPIGRTPRCPENCQIPLRIQVYLHLLETYLQLQKSQDQEGILLEDLVLMLRVEDVKHVEEMEL